MLRLRDALDRQAVFSIAEGNNVIGVSDDLVPTIVRVIVTARRTLAASIETDRSKTTHAELQESLNRMLAPFNRLTAEPWFQIGRAFPVPRLSDFLSLQYAQEDLERSFPVPERAYDEKFHILQAPSLFQADLHAYRARCELRGRSLVVGYLDVDDFKPFNTALTETVVDRDVLPRFMRCLESEVFYRGLAYRFGGDEYVVLLPNQNADGALAVLNTIRTKVAALQYDGTTRKIAVSIGFCVVEPDSMWTGQEIQQRANSAKQFAKAQGKNRVALGGQLKTGH